LARRGIGLAADNLLRYYMKTFLQGDRYVVPHNFADLSLYFVHKVRQSQYRQSLS